MTDTDGKPEVNGGALGFMVAYGARESFVTRFKS
jgi:hypothetical protein